MAESLVELGFSFSSQNAEKNIDKIIKKFGELASSALVAQKASDDMFGSGSTLKSGADAVKTALEGASAGMNTFKASIDNAKKSIEGLPKLLNGITFQGVTDKAIASYTNAGRVASQAATNASVAFNEMANAVKNATTELGVISRSGGAKGLDPKPVRDYTTAVGRATTAMNGLTTTITDSKKVANSISDVGKSANLASIDLASFYRIISQLFALGTLPTLFKNVMVSAIGFGQELAYINTLERNFDTGKIRSSILDLSAELGSATDIAHAFYIAVSAGVRQSEDVTMQFVGTSAKLASVIRSDVSTAVDAMTAAMNAYAISGENASRVSDVLFKIVDYGKANGQALAHSFGQISSTAATAGVSLEELGAAIATLSRVIPTSNAITFLNNALSKMIRPTKMSREAANRLGIEFSMASIQAKGFGTVMEEIFRAGQQNPQALLELFPDLRGQRAMLQLLGKGWGDFSTALDQFNNSAGSADRAFTVLEQDMYFQISKLVESFKRIGVAMGDLVWNVATLGGVLTPVVTWFNNLGESGRKALAGLALVTGGYITLRTMGLLQTKVNTLLSGQRLQEVAENDAVTASLERETTARIENANASRLQGASNVGAGVTSVTTAGVTGTGAQVAETKALSSAQKELQATTTGVATAQLQLSQSMVASNSAISTSVQSKKVEIANARLSAEAKKAEARANLELARAQYAVAYNQGDITRATQQATLAYQNSKMVQQAELAIRRSRSLALLEEEGFFKKNIDVMLAQTNALHVATTSVNQNTVELTKNVTVLQADAGAMNGLRVQTTALNPPMAMLSGNLDNLAISSNASAVGLSNLAIATGEVAGTQTALGTEIAVSATSMETAGAGAVGLATGYQTLATSSADLVAVQGTLVAQNDALIVSNEAVATAESNRLVAVQGLDAELARSISVETGHAGAISATTKGLTSEATATVTATGALKTYNKQKKQTIALDGASAETQKLEITQKATKGAIQKAENVQLTANNALKAENIKETSVVITELNAETNNRNRNAEAIRKENEELERQKAILAYGPGKSISEVSGTGAGFGAGFGATFNTAGFSKSWGTSMNALQSVLTGLAKAGKGALTPISSLSKVLASLKTTSSWSGALSALNIGLTGLGALLGKLASIITSVFSATNIMFGGIISIGVFLADYIIAGFDVSKTKLVSKCGEWLEGIIYGGIDKANAKVKQIDTLINALKTLDSIKAWAQGMVAQFEDIEKMLEDAPRGDGYRKSMEEMNSAIMNAIKPTENGGGYAKPVQDLLTEWDKYNNDVKKYMELSKGSTDISAIVMQTVNENIKNAYSTANHGLVEAYKEAFNQVKTITDLNQFIGGTSNNENVTKDFRNRVGNEIKQALEDYRKTLSNAMTSEEEIINKSQEDVAKFYANIAEKAKAMAQQLQEQKQALDAVSETINGIEFSRMANTEQVGKLLDEWTKGFTAFTSELTKTMPDTVLMKSSLEQALNAYNQATKILKQEFDGFSSLALSTQKDALNITKDLSKLDPFYINQYETALDAYIRELYNKAGTSFTPPKYEGDAGSWTLGNYNSASEMQKAYNYANQAISLEVQRAQERYNSAKKVADAEQKMNENTLKLMQSMDKFNSTIVPSVSAYSTEARELQSRSFGNMSNYQPLTIAQTGADVAQDELAKVMQQQIDLMREFQQASQVGANDSSAQLADWENNIATLLEKYQASQDRLVTEREELSNSLTEITSLVRESLRPLTESGRDQKTTADNSVRLVNNTNDIKQKVDSIARNGGGGSGLTIDAISYA